MKKEKLLTTVLLASILLGACASVPAGGTYYQEPVRMAPPPPYVEYIGPPPVIGHVWISGYWNWGGVRYIWVPGYWSPPRHGHHWVPHHWERNGDHWRRKGGHWEPGPQIHRPQPGHPSPRPGVGGHSRYDHHDENRYQDAGRRSALPVRPMVVADSNERPRRERPQGNSNSGERHRAPDRLAETRNRDRQVEQPKMWAGEERNNSGSRSGNRQPDNRGDQRGAGRNGRDRQGN